MPSFETTVSGKWILAGEHAVLRGAPALVFPLLSRNLTLIHRQDLDCDLTLELEGGHGEEMRMLFWGVLEKACELKKIRRSKLTGQLKISSSIPIGAGLGASAALSVAVARWMKASHLVLENEICDFARELENLFHGESSGVDIAVAHSGKPLRFVRNIEQKSFQPRWQPQWYVSYSGQRGVTIDCVNKVKNFIQQDPVVGQKVDDDMKLAVDLAESALLNAKELGFDELKSAIELAESCFDRWGLIEGDAKKHLQLLKSAGAAAVKPTGSGNGGYALSLWQSPPPAEILNQLIPCF